MDLIKDITEIVKEDKYHNIEIKIDGCGISVYLEYDPEEEENVVIPIRYETLEGFAYIPQNELIDKFKPDDYGITSDEIKLINNIMKYLESNKKEINDMCRELNCYNRKEKE